MLRFIAGFTTLLLIALPGFAGADLESFAPETAREQVAASEGIVVVDLFAEW